MWCGSHQVKRPLPLGLLLPRSYSHLLFRPTLALPCASPLVGVTGKPLLPCTDWPRPARSCGDEEVKLNLRDAEAPRAFCIRGLAEYGLPEAPLLCPIVLRSSDDGLPPLKEFGEPFAAMWALALERGVDERV